MKRQALQTSLLAGILAFMSGCLQTPDPAPLQGPVSDEYIESLMAPAEIPPTNIAECLALVLANDPGVANLRQAVRVAEAQARTWPVWRDPEISLGYGEGEQETERSWMVPRSEIQRSLRYPSKGVFATTHPEDVALQADPSIPNVVLPPDGEQALLQESPHRYKGVTADSEQYQVGVRFYPPNPLIWRAQHYTAQAAYAVAKAECAVAEWEAACYFKRQLFKACAVEQELDVLANTMKTRRQAADIAIELADNAQMPVVDALETAQRYYQLFGDRDALQAEQSALKRELKKMLGQPVPEAVWDEVRSQWACPQSGTNNLMTCCRLALQNRQDLVADYWSVQVCEGVVQEAAAARLPWFSRLEGSYGESRRTDRPEEAWELAGGSDRITSLYSLPLDDVRNSEWRVEALITVPFFSLLPGQTRVQEAQRKQAWEKLSQTTRTVLQEVEQVVEDLELAQRMNERLRGELAAQMDELRKRLDGVEADLGRDSLEAIRLREMHENLERLLLRQRQNTIMAQLLLEEMVGCDPRQPPLLFTAEEELYEIVPP